MNASAARLADQGVGSILIYTNEAHPGENYPAHRTIEDKIRGAQRLREYYQVDRPMFLDAITGELHLAFGGMSNMTWIFNKAGVPLYKSVWTDALSSENAVVYYLDVLERRRNREKLAPFKVERLDYRDVNKEKRIEGIALAGKQAIDEWQAMYDKGRLYFKPETDPG